MSNSAAKPPLKDPSKIPTAEDVDRHLYQYSRYARTVRGAARVAGLATRLTWTNQGWEEQFRLDEAVLGSLLLVKVPPMACIPVSRALEEALASRQVPEPVRNAIASAEGTQVKWIETELTGPLSADMAAALITLKTELVKAGLVPITAAERPKQVPRPEAENPARPITRPSTPVPVAVRTTVAEPAPAKARSAAPTKARSAPAPVKSKSAPKAKPAAKSLKAKAPVAKKPAKPAKAAKRR